jgi:DNA-binding transcriptional regulator YdaS (Cro superfamily)
MNLSQYLLQERGRQASLARAIGAHAPDICRWADGTRPVPVAHGAAIEAATGGLVTRKELFPNDWQRIWPELIEHAVPEAQPQ